MKKTHHKLTAIEREKISIWLSGGLSKREIARRLGRSDSSIREEIIRNSFAGHYVAVHAQRQAQKRMVTARRRHSLKNKSVFKFVLKKLRSGWSPEQIAGRLKLRHPNNLYWHIHHETIYRYIYDPVNHHKAWFEYLPHKQKKRRRKYGRKSQKVRIPNRVSIHSRPEEIEARQEFGHWEGDSVEGKAHKGGLHTQVERKTRLSKAIIVSRLTAEEAVKAQEKIFRPLPKEAKRSSTVDNGKEFTNHEQFDLPIYFADPYSSHQRGTNEYHNGLIRRYLPKGTDFSTLTQGELDDIIKEINNRPRKCLGFKTPTEAFREELQIIQTARIPSRM